MKRAFALCRASSPEQNLESQSEALIAIAKTMGFEITDVFEQKISGYDKNYDEDRESIIALRAAISAYPPEAIFIWELSRLSRRALKVIDYINEFSVSPKIPMYFQDFDLWTLNPETREKEEDNILTLFGAAKGVEKEREMIMKRTSRGRELAARKGLYVGHLVDGYIAEVNDKKEKVIKIDKDRVGVIKRIFDLYDIEDYSTYQIKDILNSEDVPITNLYRLRNPFWNYKEHYSDRTNGILNRENAKWTSVSISRVLTNEWYIGKRYFKGVEYPIDAIIDIEQWNRVQNKLKAKRIFPASPNGKNFYLLQGLLYCGKCGKKMYAQNGGLCNHYYCSSKDSKKCGLIGICQENIDAIIYGLLMPRFRLETIKDSNSIISRILGIGSKQKSQMQEDIKKFSKVITSTEKELDKQKKVLANLYREKAAAEDDFKGIVAVSITNVKSKIKELQSEIAKYQRLIKDTDNAIKKAESTVTLLQKLDSSSLEEIRELIRLIVAKIELFNADVSITVIRITYINGMVENVLYSPRLMPVKYINLSSELSPLLYHDGLSEELKVIMGTKHPDSEELFIRYDTEQNVLCIRDDLTILFDSKLGAIVWDGALAAIKGEFDNRKMTWDFDEYHDKIGVRDFVLKCRHSNTVVHEYERLNPLSEKALKQQERYREWRKKYNTGKPTCEPYVKKDELYEHINQERHKLYNRIYKIKKNKHLTDTEKRQEIQVIKERLKELRFQIHYFGESKLATKYKR